MGGVIAENRRSGTRLLDRFRLGRDQRIDVTPLQSTVDLGIGVAGIGGDGRDVLPRCRAPGIHLRLDHVSFIALAGRDFHVQDDAAFIVDGRVLLIRRLQTPVAGIRRHCRVGIGHADLLIFATLPVLLLGLRLRRIGAEELLHMPLGHPAPADIGADYRTISPVAILALRHASIKRRTEVVRICPNEAAIIRLVGAIRLEQSDEWAVQRARYMTLETIATMSDDPIVSLPAVAS